jgi:hypothetical protein
MKNLKACEKCGQVGQWRLQYDNGWEIQCNQCSKIVPIPDSDIPKGLDHRRYDVAEIKSPTEVSTTFSLSHLGITPPRVMWGNRGNLEM